MENWEKEMKVTLDSKTKQFSILEKQHVSYTYFTNLLSRIEEGSMVTDVELRSKLEYVINDMPQKNDGKLRYNRTQLIEISNLQLYVEEKFGLIKKGKFKRKYLPLGLTLGPALGLAFGVLLGKIALGLLIGIPIGMLFGVAYGNKLETKAEKENRVL
ncbi:hypothetical protein FLAN108750_04200 [Flavobacterium antarcticum]|uniref:hypothetical protein n=1 Tax=Flavobacterium antarcticum TaxID=271155 RepID=UPI0003B64EC1|nr:hypothetical protein [Flavobacterium antarcticum]